MFCYWRVVTIAVTASNSDLTSWAITSVNYLYDTDIDKFECNFTSTFLRIQRNSGFTAIVTVL